MSIKSKSRLLSFILMLACLAAPINAFANGGPKDRTFGLGLQLGVPYGITGKIFLGSVAALQFGIGFIGLPNIVTYEGAGSWLDLVFHFVHLNTASNIARFSFYVGPGIQFGWVGPPKYQYFAGPAHFSLRIPIGFAIHWQTLAFDTYVEGCPNIVFLPGPIAVGPSFSVGARYYF